MTATVYECPEHGPLGIKDYTIGHRCKHCGRAIIAMVPKRPEPNIENGVRVVRVPYARLRELVDQCTDPSVREALWQYLEGR
ncbi:hypothetical protein PRZ61_12430 [Halomonas pacifica]|uniref:hypothetical protein n=1 Tax=Bisbaumannia pacifica TaxID=77098 RepID=UPI00235A0D9F|nr:hypothetical protein [Halomonas pacifica]MDC8804248.1 hypothetical protein [Halomonas pacifica]